MQFITLKKPKRKLSNKTDTISGSKVEIELPHDVFFFQILTTHY